MKYLLRYVVAFLVFVMINACSVNRWDKMLNKLIDNEEVNVMLHTKKFPERHQFYINKEDLIRLLGKIKHEKIDQPTTEENFSIVISGKNDYTLKIYDNAISLDDEYNYKLTDELQINLLSLYDDSVYGNDADLFQRTKINMNLGVFSTSEYYVDYSPERFEIPLEIIKEEFLKLSVNQAKPSGKLKFMIDVYGPETKTTFLIRESSMSISDGLREGTYALSSEHFRHLQSIVEKDYLNRSLITDDLNGSDFEAPVFLSLELQDLYRRTLTMYHYFSLGTLYSNYMSGLTDCVFVKTDIYQRCFSRTNYEKFPTYDAFDEYLSQLFSEELKKELLSNGTYQNINGYLYVSSGNRGSDNSFRKKSFELISDTNEKIQFYVIGHYSQDMFSDEIDETRKFLIELKKFDTQWKFTKFDIPY